MTQIATIKHLLASGSWVCGQEFQREYIPEYRTRINEIRKEGIQIEARKCQTHRHVSKNTQEWRIKIAPPTFQNHHLQNN